MRYILESGQPIGLADGGGCEECTSLERQICTTFRENALGQGKGPLLTSLPSFLLHVIVLCFTRWDVPPRPTIPTNSVASFFTFFINCQFFVEWRLCERGWGQDCLRYWKALCQNWCWGTDYTDQQISVGGPSLVECRSSCGGISLGVCWWFILL